MKKKLLVLIPFLVVIISFICVYRYYNKENKTTSLTISEKRWIEQNKDQTYDFEVINDYPLYGLNGEGVIFDLSNPTFLSSKNIRASPYPNSSNESPNIFIFSSTSSRFLLPAV